MRRRTNSLSVVIRTGPYRSAQSDHRALHVWWSKGSDAHRPEHEIPVCQCALFVERHAHDRRRVLSHLSNQASAAAPELGSSLRRGRRTSSPSQFEPHFLFTIREEHRKSFNNESVVWIARFLA